MSPSQSAMCQWGWGFHTLRGDTAPGYPRTHPPIVGVVHVCKDVSSEDGNLSFPTCQWGWGFHTVRGGLDPGDHRFRPHVAGVVKVWKDFFLEDETPSSSDATRPRRWPAGKILPRVGFMSSSQSATNPPVGLEFPHHAGQHRPGGSKFSSPGIWACRDI